MAVEIDAGRLMAMNQAELDPQRIRDEIREVAPGLYLGVVFWDRLKILNFSLNFQ